MFKAGDKVKLIHTDIINHQKYIGQIGEIELPYNNDGLTPLAYVLVKAPGQRKPRSIIMRQESLLPA